MSICITLSVSSFELMVTPMATGVSCALALDIKVFFDLITSNLTKCKNRNETAQTTEKTFIFSIDNNNEII